MIKKILQPVSKTGTTVVLAFQDLRAVTVQELRLRCDIPQLATGKYRLKSLIWDWKVYDTASNKYYDRFGNSYSLRYDASLESSAVNNFVYPLDAPVSPRLMKFTPGVQHLFEGIDLMPGAAIYLWFQSQGVILTGTMETWLTVELEIIQ